MSKLYYVYIATNWKNTVLYTGVTNDLDWRMFEHKNKSTKGFTSKYNVNKLVYYDTFQNVSEAIEAEKKIKGGSRKKKIVLIENINPQWKDLISEV